MKTSITSQRLTIIRNTIFKTFSKNAIFLYFIAFLIFGIQYRILLPSINHIFLQFLTLFIFAFLCYYSFRSKVNINHFFSLIFFCILFEIIIFRIWNVVVYDNPLGYDPRDSLSYHELALKFATGHYLLFDAVEYIKNSGASIDDYGYKTIICLTYKIFSPEIGIHILAVFNAFVCTLSCVVLYKLGIRLNISRDGCKYISILWGCFTYSIYTASVGLKENFFCFFIILSFYWLYKYHYNRNKTNLIIFLLVSLICILFRLAVYFIIICTFLFSIAIKYKIINKHMKFWVITGISISIALVPLIITYISNMRGNMAISQGYADAIASGSNVFIYTAMNILAVFTGSIPSFIADIEKQNYITLWNFGTFVRLLLSGYSFYGIYYIIRNRIIKFYPIIFYVVLHSVMLIVTMFSLQDRYQMIQLPCVYILIVYGMTQIRNAKKNTKLFYNKIYLAGATLFVILFNIYKFR